MNSYLARCIVQLTITYLDVNFITTDASKLNLDWQKSPNNIHLKNKGTKTGDSIPNHE